MDTNIQHFNFLFPEEHTCLRRNTTPSTPFGLDTRNSNIFSEIQKISKYKCHDAMPNTLMNEAETISYTSDSQKANGFATLFEKLNDTVSTGNDATYV